MKQFTQSPIIPVSTVMNANLNSVSLQAWNVLCYSIQVVFTGTPTGTFKLQASCDPSAQAVSTGNYTSAVTAPVHWSDIANTSTMVSSAGNVFWNMEDIGYNWIRVVYTDGSSGMSTAIITSAVFSAKGF